MVFKEGRFLTNIVIRLLFKRNLKDFLVMIHPEIAFFAKKFAKELSIKSKHFTDFFLL